MRKVPKIKLEYICLLLKMAVLVFFVLLNIARWILFPSRKGCLDSVAASAVELCAVRFFIRRKVCLLAPRSGRERNVMHAQTLQHFLLHSYFKPVCWEKIQAGQPNPWSIKKDRWSMFNRVHLERKIIYMVWLFINTDSLILSSTQKAMQTLWQAMRNESSNVLRHSGPGVGTKH